MLSFPNAKINIGLNITGKRPDGFHDLETIFYPIPIKDALEIIEAEASGTDIIFSSSGNEVSGNEENNLCIKAYRLLKKDFPGIPTIKMHLHKHIPMGAGLGGGSSDAAAALILLNKKFNLNISVEALQQYALSLGSDCPFFILNTPCMATGRGEILTAFPLDLSAYKIMIVHPGIHVSTAKAFSELDEAGLSSAGKLEAAIPEDISHWKNTIKNDFERTVFAQYPELKEIRDKMYENSALYSAMSGSGSSIYGIFLKDTVINIKFPSHWFCQTI